MSRPRYLCDCGHLGQRKHVCDPAPCVVASVRCNDCPRVYARCQHIGGEAGAKRSLHSHRGLYHPKERT
jgi:hypothetical protein